MTGERVLDVCGLEPPEPLERALAALDTLASGEYLRLRIHRAPYPLYSMLEQWGYVYRVRNGADSSYEILIWRAGDKQAERAAVHA